MAGSDSSISALTSGSPAVGTDLYVIARGGVNYKLTLAQMLAAGDSPITGTTITATTRMLSGDGDLAGPGIAFTSDPDVGFYLFGANTGAITAGSQPAALWNASSFFVYTNLVVGIASDANFSRISANLIGVGTGAAGSTAGSLSLTNLTASGNVGVGASPAAGTLTITGKYFLASDSQTKLGDAGIIAGGAANAQSQLDYFTGQSLIISESGSTRAVFTTGNLTLTGLLQPEANNTRDLGLTGTRWRTGYFGTSVVAAAYVVGASAGVDFGPGLPTSITVVKGIITAAS